VAGWRYIAQHPTTGEFIDWDVPLSGVALTRRLSGPWGMSAKLEPELMRMLNPDGSRRLDEWAVQVWAEKDGAIRGGGILTDSKLVGAQWDMTFEGHARYPHGIPYAGLLSRTNYDPLDAYRAVWDHVQSYDDGNLGVVVDPLTSPVRVGIPAVPSYWQVSFSPEGTPTADMVWVREDDVNPDRVEAKSKGILAAELKENATTCTVRDGAKFAGIPFPFTVKIGAEYVRVRGRTGNKLEDLIRGWDREDQEGKPAKRSGHSKGSGVTYDGTPRRLVKRVAAVPYLLAWWEAPDCGDELETLAKETPFEFVEAHEWDGDELAHRIRLGYPRLGRRRTDISFVEGENLAVAPPLERNGETFAQYVLGLGAGEGRGRRRTGMVGSADGRLRRVHVLERSDVRTLDRLQRLAATEQAARKNLGSVPDVVAFDHPNAPLGSWELGDEVQVTLRDGWANDSVWCRIVEDVISPENDREFMGLKLIRADGL
jgi:hypothetical protein